MYIIKKRGLTGQHIWNRFAQNWKCEIQQQNNGYPKTSTTERDGAQHSHVKHHKSIYWYNQVWNIYEL